MTEEFPLILFAWSQIVCVFFNMNLSPLFFISQQMKAAIKLIVRRVHAAFNCHIRKSICTVQEHSWCLRRAPPPLFLKMKTCLVNWGGRTLNMHQGDIKGLTPPLLLSVQGVFCSFSCTNGATRWPDGDVKCTVGTMVRWKEMSN